VSARRQLWAWTAAAVAAAWIAAAAGIAFFRSQRVTAEKVIAYLGEQPLRGLPAAERMRRVEGLADRVNRLDFDERQKFRLEKGIRRAFLEMTDAERNRYLELTLPSGMRNMMEAFNKMTPQKRKKVVDRAVHELARLSEHGDRAEMEKALGDENVKKIAAEGMKAYLSEASAQAKLDLQPLLEQVQNILQMGR
jgi:lauroyl/myristoyl acyltransferase